jgi:hypothetical protein
MFVFNWYSHPHSELDEPDEPDFLSIWYSLSNRYKIRSMKELMDAIPFRFN